LGELLPAASASPLTETGSLLEQYSVPLSVGFTGLVSTALTIWLQAMCFKRLPAMDASLVLTTEPLWACMFGVLLLHDSLKMGDYIGGSLIICALLANEGVGFPSDDDEADTA